MNSFILFAEGLVIGVMIGLICKERKLERLNQAQRERGDYWFLRYQEMIRNESPYPSQEDSDE